MLVKQKHIIISLHEVVMVREIYTPALRKGGGQEGKRGGARSDKQKTTDHLVKVFCCTLIHCFSTVNMIEDGGGLFIAVGEPSRALGEVLCPRIARCLFFSPKKKKSGGSVN